MKNKFLTLVGATGLAATMMIGMLATSQKAEASSVEKLNVQFLTNPGQGKCTGPKDVEKQTCKSENTNPCSDTSGCNS